MRRTSTRAIALILPLALSFGCDAGSASTHGAGTDDTNETPLDECPKKTDADGDLYFVTDWTGCEEKKENAPWEGEEDCDDTDPELNWSTDYFEDVDGDGYGDVNGEHLLDCYGIVIEGFVTNADDCAPDDPDRYAQLYLDEDGDGVGSTLECPAHDSPHHVLLSGDCDDTSSAISTGAEELALDGIDSNCDGEDAPLITCGESTEIAVPEGASCDGIGLAFLARSECQGKCGGGTGVVSIVNMGSEASPAATLRYTREGASNDAELPIPALAPGEVYVTPTLDVYLELVIELPDDTANCAPEQSRRTHLNGNYNLC